MYPVFNEALGWKESQLPTEKLMLISDSLAADGAFLLPHFINLFVKSKQRVVLVGLEQGFSHYLSICKKLVRFISSIYSHRQPKSSTFANAQFLCPLLTYALHCTQGVNLQQAHTSGQIVYINAIAAPYDWTDAVVTETNNPATAALHSIANANPFSLQTHGENTSGDPLEPLFRLVERHVSTQDPRSVCLIFDNLSALTPVVGEDQLVLFVQSCRALVEEHSNMHQISSCAVALAHKDVDELLVSALSHTADLVMKVDGFKTGYSNEEDGQVRDPFEKLLEPQTETFSLTSCSSSPSSLQTPSSTAITSYQYSSTRQRSQPSTSE